MGLSAAARYAGPTTGTVPGMEPTTSPTTGHRHVRRSVDEVDRELTRAQAWDSRGGDWTPKFRGWNLAGLKLADRRFNHADFTSANLTSADFREADLTGANLRNADLTDSNLGYADLTGANLTGANLRGALLYRANCSPRQLWGTYGLNPSDPWSGLDDPAWDEILPTDSATRALAKRLLEDWVGTLKEALDAADELRRA